ncbi:transposase IS116/IS110/IS902 family protein [Paraburkholderia sp. BL21I4N1]|nr:transposase IS116/IS110/IS902 family protein [Paraburkholderia sp. BL21I4N1]
MRLKARQQLKAFLLRQGRVYPGKTAWSRMHLRWLADQRFEQSADQLAFAEYRHAVEDTHARVERLNGALEHSALPEQVASVVAALRALRGIDTVSAIGLVAEIGDIGRFATARQLMGYLGLVPSEHSSGGTVRRGAITKTGNAHARRLLTESAWNYRFAPRVSRFARSHSPSSVAQGIFTRSPRRPQKMDMSPRADSLRVPLAPSRQEPGNHYACQLRSPRSTRAQSSDAHDG